MNDSPENQNYPRREQPAKPKTLSTKLIFIGVITAALMVPLTLISGLVEERRDRFDQTREEIMSKWGSEVTVKGPLIVIPYETAVDQNDKTSRRVRSHAFLLPRRMNVNGKVNVESRKRGIYVKNVYSSQLSFNGAVAKPKMKQFPANTTHVFWDEARVIVKVPNQREVVGNVTVKVGDQELELQPSHAIGNYNTFVLQSHPFNFDKAQSRSKKQIPVQMVLPIRGADGLKFAPFAGYMQVSLHGNWPDPSFVGASLPSSSYINDKGFDVEWVDSSKDHGLRELETTIPAAFANASDYRAFGVSMITTVDHYQKVNRTLKYAILFVLLTFTAFFMFEVLAGLQLHPIQYLLVGCGLVLFYLLLLSLAEHINFIVSYALATLSVVGLVGGYTSSILKQTKRGITIAMGLTTLYSYLYFLLIMEQFSLLFGSFGLFAVLALIMYITRNIDWYAIGKATTQQNSLSLPSHS